MTIAEKLTAVKENIPKVYESGKKDNYSEFWDSYQQKGNRTNYEMAFASWWTEVTFNPKYDLSVDYGTYMFYYSLIPGDLREILSENNVTLNLKKASENGRIDYIFTASKFSNLPVLDFSGLAGTSFDCLADCNMLETVDKIILNSDGTADMYGWFTRDSNLKEIRFEGTIGCNVDFHWSTKLSALSLWNILQSLKQFGIGTTKSITLSTTAEETYVNAFGESEWNMLMATVSSKGWNVLFKEV